MKRQEELTAMERRIRDVKTWQAHRGKKEYLQFLEGGKSLTVKAAALAKCYDCMCGYDAGPMDCKIAWCALYPWMPYLEGGPRKAARSTAQVEALERIRAAKSPPGKP